MPELKSPTRIKNGKQEVFVREVKREHRTPRKYWRKKRPRSSKRIVTKKVVKFNLIQDPQGRIMGFKKVK